MTRSPLSRGPLLAAVLALLVGAVACRPKLEVTHAPLNPDPAQPVTYTATASDPQGIAAIRLIVNGNVVKTCNGSTSCSITIVSSAPSGSVLFYGAEADDGKGNTARRGSYYYGVGDWGLWAPARLTERPSSQAIDLCFAMDEDYGGNVALFQMEVFDKIHNRLFEADVVRSHTEKYNFYLARFPMSPGECGVLQTVFEASGSYCDAFALLHQEQFRDCSIGDNFSAEGFETQAFVHEAGHALYGLADEYEGETSYSMAPNFPNIFGDFVAGSAAGQLLCQDQVASLNGDPSLCNEFCDDPSLCGAGWWRHGTGTTMMSQGFFSDPWGLNARARVSFLHGLY